MDLAAEVRTLAEGHLAPGQFLVDVWVSSGKGPKKIVVTADGDEGFSIDDCAELSRRLLKSLDERGLGGSEFTLEVSTPGLDQPLKIKRQYYKNIGRRLKVKLPEGTVEGRLTEVTEEKIILARETGSGKKKEIQQMEIPFPKIEKAFVLVSFN